MSWKLLPLFILAFGFVTVSAQKPDEKPKTPVDYVGPVVSTSNGGENKTDSRQISGGVLNGKARSLPKPAYPAAARAVGASGAVTVQVLIDENGNVVSATAVSGHPLLRAASQQAARGAVFSPTLLQGQPVKVSGVITYNYVLPMTLAKLGFVIAAAERSASFAPYTNLYSFERELPTSWVTEKELLKTVTYEAAKEPEVHKVPPPAAKKFEGKVEEAPGEKYTYVGPVFSASGAKVQKIDQRSLETLRLVSDMIADRLAQDERSTWNFNLGRALGRTVADGTDGTDDNKLAADLTAIESLVALAPASVSSDLVQTVRDFVAKGRQSIGGTAGRVDLASEAERLSNKKY